MPRALRAMAGAARPSFAESGYPVGADVAFNLTLPGDRMAAVARAIRPGGRLLTITYPVPQQAGRHDVSTRPAASPG